jgi:hypothetical protein
MIVAPNFQISKPSSVHTQGKSFSLVKTIADVAHPDTVKTSTAGLSTALVPLPSSFTPLL